MIFIFSTAYIIIPIFIIYFIFKFIIFRCYSRTQNSIFRSTFDNAFYVYSRFSSHTVYEPRFENIKRILFAKSIWTVLYVLAGILLVNFPFGDWIVSVFTFVQLMRAYAELKYYKQMKADLPEGLPEADHVFLTVYRLPFIYQCIQFIITPILIYCYGSVITSIL